MGRQGPGKVLLPVEYIQGYGPFISLGTRSGQNIFINKDGPLLRRFIKPPAPSAAQAFRRGSAPLPELSERHVRAAARTAPAFPVPIRLQAQSEVFNTAFQGRKQTQVVSDFPLQPPDHSNEAARAQPKPLPSSQTFALDAFSMLAEALITLC